MNQKYKENIDHDGIVIYRKPKDKWTIKQL